NVTGPLTVNMGAAATAVTVTGAGTFSSALTVTQGTLTLNGASSVATALTVSASGTLVSSNNLTVTTTTGITGVFKITGGATHTHTGAVTINNGGLWNNTGDAPVSFGNSLTNNSPNDANNPPATGFFSGAGLQTFQTTAATSWAGTAGLNFAG